MRHVTSAVLVCLLAIEATAAPPAPPPAVKVTVGELARIEITPDKAGVVGWASGATDADLFVDELSTKAEKVRLLVQAKRAGTYRIVLWTKGETGSTFVEVVAGGDEKKQDDTKPPPTPQPDDQKKGSVKSVRLAYVSESADLDVNKGQFYQDKALQAFWKEKGWDGVWWIDPDSVDPATKQMPAKWKPYADRAKALGLTKCVFVVDRDTGKVLYEGAPPASPDALLKLIKDTTGG